MKSSFKNYWFSAIFIPCLRDKKKRKAYDGPSLLILDGFSAHSKVTSTIPQSILDELNLRILYIPPHTSDQFQPLDLIIFGVQKLRYNQIRKASKNPRSKLDDADFSDFDQQSKHIINVYRSLQQASDIGNITSSFECAGILFSSPVRNIFTGQLEQYHCFEPSKYSKARIDLEKLSLKMFDFEKIDEIYSKQCLAFKVNFVVKGSNSHQSSCRH